MSLKFVKGQAKLVLVDDVDTDQIFHASLLTIHDPVKIKPYIFGNLPNFTDFGKENHTNEILIVGKNFGKGSTRQQAVTGFLAHNIYTIIGESFGPIYYGNAVNSGLLLIEVPNIRQFDVSDGDELEIDIQNSELINRTQEKKIQTNPIPKPVLDIINAGGLLELGKRLK
jgi:3-isopropylmalate/(R)-2-methylmalate dehydratase small subunit